jgi:DNA-directed RNA polymerase specialized sigma24 family protein
MDAAAEVHESADLERRFAAGDLDAFETLFRRHQAEVFGWIVRMLRDGPLAEDATIETFWRIYRARARFDGQHEFGAWARRIATNVAIDFLKARSREVAGLDGLEVRVRPGPIRISVPILRESPCPLR